MMQLNTPKKIILIQEVSVMADKIKVNHVIDNGNMVEVDIDLIKEGQSQNQIWTLWDGQDYIDIGNWTDEDVKNRILELI